MKEDSAMTNCAKITYPDKQSANRALRAIIAKGARPRGKVPTNVYPCGECKGWHLTSKKAPAVSAQKLRT